MTYRSILVNDSSPEWQYLYDIAKSSKQSGSEDKRMPITKSADAYKMLEEKADFTKNFEISGTVVNIL